MSVLQKEFAHLQIPLKDILSATNNFADENVITKGGFGQIYTGQLVYSGQPINIVARRLDPEYAQGSKEFMTEISMLSNLNHINLVSIIGFCDENDEKITIYRQEVNGVLDQHLSGQILSWTQRLKICVGVARALSYIHYDEARDFSVIHGNINSSKISLDESWEPKLSGFEVSMRNPTARRHRLLLTEFGGTIGYVDPAYEKTGGLSHKSDVFSFGVVLFEILFGRTASINTPEKDNWYFARLARLHYDEQKLDDMIDPDLRIQMELQSLKVFSETAYYCLKEQRAERPNIEQIIRRLENALEIQSGHENQKNSTVAAQVEVTSSYHQKMRVKIAKYSSLSRHPPAADGLPFLSHNPPTIQANGNIISLSLQEFGHLQIPLEDVASATNNFSDANILEEGGLERIYKGQLLRAGQLIDIVARRLDHMGGKVEMEMFMEISLLSSLKDNNVVSVLGFCNENNEKIIIYEHAVHRSVDQHLCDPNITWSQRLQLCLGVARALNYIHCKDVIHCDISRSKILIDKDMEAKVFGFGLSTKYPGNWGHRLLFSYYLETSTYKDPMYINTRSVTPKYDVYAFGVFLYEVLCGRKPMMIGYNGLKEKMDDMIDPDLRKQMDTQSLTMFTKTAHNCLIQQHMQRPTMLQVVKELKDALERQKKPETLEQSTQADQTTPSNTLKIENIERLEIRLSDIRSATNNFDKGSCIGSGGYGMVYKAELDHLDIQSLSLLEGKNKNKMLKKRSTVAIKRIFNNEGKEGFLAEIETLSSCNHPNIVSLLGFASEDREMILVFEFASRGSLDNCLENNKMFNVTWAQRLQICIDIAQGLHYLHSNLEGKPRIVHRDVKSANVLASTIHTIHLVGTEVYVDPEYSSTFAYKKESDIYSYGVVLFEILSGKLAYDAIYNVGDDVGLASVARRRFKEGTLKELIDPNMLDEADEHILTVNKGPNQESLDTFLKIAHQCVAETQSKRPPMEVVIKELQNALNVQGKASVLMKFRLSDIKSVTKNFADKYCVGVGAYGMMYNAKLDHFDRKSLSEIEGKNAGELPKKRTNVALKRVFNREDEHGKQGLFAEIEMLASCEHPNIVSHLGICSEDREMILVYEDGFKGSLHDFLGNNYKLASLTWVQRIQICLDIAHGLTYLNTNIEDKQRIMHFDMNSANILLTVNWRARIACFWLSYNTYNSVATKVQLDPEYIKIGKLKRESSIYSLGIILFEILCGRLEYDEMYYVENEKGLPNIARRRIDEGTLHEIIDPILKEETDENIFELNKEVNQHSLDAFSKLAYRCLAETQADRPSTEVVIKELQNALNFQMEYLEQLKIQDVEKKGNLEHLKIPLSDILKATENFSKTHEVGSGGYGTVYKAELDYFDGINSEGKNKGKRHGTVAIKRIYHRSDDQGEVGFFTEIEALSNYKHKNIVSLLGFCDEGSEMILIYEYVSNRSLDGYLGNTDSMNSFTWAQRIQICLDIAHGLAYLHSSTEDKKMIIHRDIKSPNILLDDNWVAKISDFGLSKLHVANQKAITLNTNMIAGTEVYLDPEYMMTGRLKKESDIYSFGVVLFEIMCGRLAYDLIYLNSERLGLAPVARRCFNEGKLKELIDPKLTENDDNLFMLNGGLSQDSIDTFSKIAYQCLAETQAKRPPMELIIQELEKALYSQENNKNALQIPLEDIKLATQNFNDSKCIGEGRDWKEYEGEIPLANGYTSVVVKRFNSNFDQRHHQFLKELEILYEYKHENIIGLAGYCDDADEKIIVFENVSNGMLSRHFHNTSVTWMKRLNICIDVACALHFLHIGGATKDIPIMHRDIKSTSILLDGDWKAKISNFELSLKSWEREEIEHTYGSSGYMDPQYEQNGYLTEKSDIYSLGVILVEMLCGRLAWAEGCENHSQSLGPKAKRFYKEGKLDELVFEGIKEQIDSSSLTTFVNSAFQCLDDDGDKRPEANEVVTQLKKALEFQEDYDIWEPKLPRDYEEILRFSKMENMLNTYHTKKDIYHILCKGVPLRDREVCLSLGSNGEKNYMISAKKFSYKYHWALKWGHIPESRFENVAEMLTVSNLKINIKIRTRFLSPGVYYGVHLIFKFGGPRKSSSEAMYVNLTYKMGGETFHAFFATWRADEWMMIELCQFCHNEDTNFEALLESFSRCYCGSGAIYIEGIEFRPIHNVKREEIVKLKEVQQLVKSNTNMDQAPGGNEEFFVRSENDEVNRKKRCMVSAKEVLFDSSNVKQYHLKSSTESRFEEVIELLRHQILHIKCKIGSEMLSPDSNYMCYLVFKISGKCHGLHCPTKVRDVLNWKEKESGTLYFRPPSPWNLHDGHRVPEKREDGWMEVMIWKFNSTSHLRNDHIPMNLKLITYEGTMSGIIVCGLEIRPM